MNKKTPIITAVVGIIIGVGIGVAASSTDAVTSKEVPKACLQALDNADVMTDVTIGYIEASLDWPDLVYRAGMAGLDQDSAEIEQVSNDMNDITQRNEDLSTELGEAPDNFREHSESCRESAGEGS